jgi:hypothetical protein
VPWFKHEKALKKDIQIGMYWVMRIECLERLHEIQGRFTIDVGRGPGGIEEGRKTATEGFHILPLHALCDRDLQQQSRSRPGKAGSQRPSSSSLLPRLYPSLSHIGHAPLRLPVTRLMTVHVRICLCPNMCLSASCIPGLP